MTTMTNQPAHRDRRLLPPVYFLLAILMMVGLHVGLPVAHWLPWPSNLAGTLLIVVGLAMVVIADYQFKRHGTTVKPFQRSSVLVTDGMFRYSRNPMYLGMVVALVGLAVAFASVSPLLVVPVFAWRLTVRFIGAEETALAAQFGGAYLEYKRAVRRWL